LRTECRVVSLRQQEVRPNGTGRGYELTVERSINDKYSSSKQTDTERLQADAVILALPSQASARLLRELAPEASEALQEIKAVSTATVHLAYRRKDLSAALPGSGFVVPSKENRRIRGVT